MIHNQIIMGTATIHPSQRRFSCEGCRKIKARCQRSHAKNAKCARCTLLDLDCTAGQQKRVGRPRRAGTADGEVLKHPKNSDSTLSNQQSTPVKEHNHLENLISSPETSSNKEGNHQHWGMDFPTGPSIAAFVATDDVTYFGAQAWPANDTRSFHQKSLTWDAFNDIDRTSFLSSNNSTFSSTLSSASSFNTPSTASSPADRIHNAIENMSETLGAHRTDFITNSDAMAQLSKINIELHIRMVAVEANRATLDFNGIVYEKGPLFIGNLTLARFLLEASQDFMLILTRILSSRPTSDMSFSGQTMGTTLLGPLTLSSQAYLGKTHNPTSTYSSIPSPTSELLSTPLALLITSIFTQLVPLCELNVELLAARLEQIATNPIVYMPALTFSGLLISEPCIVGIVFCDTVIHLLESIDQALGLNCVLGISANGLLSARQKDVLWSELDGGHGITPGHGFVRYINVRKAFGKAGIVLRQISLDQFIIRN